MTWYDDDNFWQAMAPFIFDARRWLEVPAEVDQLVKLIEIAPPASVLDLCCGPGRHALEFARRGFQVVGVDRTQFLLKQAAERAQNEGLKLELVQADMRDSCRPGVFDAVLSLYTSFGYFEDPEDDRKVLEQAHRSLKPGGWIVIDLFGKEILARIFRERDWVEEGGAIRLRETKVSRNWGWIDARWILVTGTSRQEFTISHRLYCGTELEALLKQCGFDSIQILGSLAAKPYDQNAERLVALARKPSV